MTRDAIADSHANLLEAFSGLADHGPDGRVETFGMITAVSTGVPLRYLNRVFVLEPPDRDDLERAIAWMGGGPFLVTVAGPVLDAAEGVETTDGLGDRAGTEPGMVRDTLEGIPPTGPTVDIEEATRPEEAEVIARVTVANTDMPVEVARRIVPPAMLAGDAFRAFVARVDDRAVGRGLLFRHGDVAGVYNVGVVESHRRRGIGEALTWAVLRAGREDGAALGVLQSSEMGYSLYERMGFETVVGYHHFGPR